MVTVTYATPEQASAAKQGGATMLDGTPLDIRFVPVTRIREEQPPPPQAHPQVQPQGHAQAGHAQQQQPRGDRPRPAPSAPPARAMTASAATSKGAQDRRGEDRRGEERPPIVTTRAKPTESRADIIKRKMAAEQQAAASPAVALRGPIRPPASKAFVDELPEEDENDIAEEEPSEEEEAEEEVPLDDDDDDGGGDDEDDEDGEEGDEDEEEEDEEEDEGGDEEGGSEEEDAAPRAAIRIRSKAAPADGDVENEEDEGDEAEEEEVEEAEEEEEERGEEAEDALDAYMKQKAAAKRAPVPQMTASTVQANIPSFTTEALTHVDDSSDGTDGLVGQAYGMCPVSEINERSKSSYAIPDFEKDLPTIGAEAMMLKEYKRSAAGTDEQVRKHTHTRIHTHTYIRVSVSLCIPLLHVFTRGICADGSCNRSSSSCLGENTGLLNIHHP
jgi:hypothetical protein